LTGVVSVDADDSHTVALKNDGTVWAWGYNYSGEIGDSTRTERLTPVQVPGLTAVVDVSAGSGYTAAVKSDGTVWAWGSNIWGNLGDGTTTDRWTPVQVMKDSLPFKSQAVSTSNLVGKSPAGGTETITSFGCAATPGRPFDDSSDVAGITFLLAPMVVLWGYKRRPRYCRFLKKGGAR
jgi:hypothetical protein